MMTPTVIDLTPDLHRILLSSRDVECDRDYGHMAVAPGNEPKPKPVVAEKLL
jgi:hypothetical protein